MSPLPGSFRKLPIDDRRAFVRENYPAAEEGIGADPDAVELADVMVESAVGYLALPLGIAVGFLIDGESFDVPMATEEPSVVAAAGYAASIVRRSGGFTTEGGEPITTAQLFVESCPANGAEALAAAECELRDAAAPVLTRMEQRGGGWRGFDVETLPESEVVRLQVHVDVRDAMGANTVNSVAEALRGPVEAVTGGRVIMAILTNTADRRVVTARFSIPVSQLIRAGVQGPEVARRIVSANRIAREDAPRAVTHNKGVMNGITAVALATGNDTRAIEAAVHEYASRSGTYRALTLYRVKNGTLQGEMSVPLPIGTVGGAAGMHPTSGFALELLAHPSAMRLARIMASVGLAQNLAALFALVTEGIQRGHMGLHANRIAWMAGARGGEREHVVALMRAASDFSTSFARAALERVRTDDAHDRGES